MRLNIGYGDDHPEGWDNANISAHVQDGLHDGLNFLPFESDTVELVYFGYGLEYIPLPDVRMALLDIHRVLEPGGCLCVLGFMPRDERDDPTRAPWRYEPSPLELAMTVRHVQRKWVCYFPRLHHIVADVFPNTVTVTMRDLLPEWPIRSRSEWQRALLAYKD